MTDPVSDIMCNNAGASSTYWRRKRTSVVETKAAAMTRAQEPTRSNFCSICRSHSFKMCTHTFGGRLGVG